MNNCGLSLLLLVLLIGNYIASVYCAGGYRRDDFPVDFKFGAGTSAYQVEGAVLEDGRTPSIWDTFAHSGHVSGNGDVACDSYHKYKEDVQLMVDTDGRGPVNPKGLQYYNNLINELIRHGIQPHVVLCHMDLPKVLEDEYGGWLDEKSVKDFVAYADVCFREFGDRVLHWTTINEANIAAVGGYDNGSAPPSHCSPPFAYYKCKEGNSTTELYIAGRNMLLSHASAVRLYRRKYKATQGGFVGICLYTLGFEPLTNSVEDVIATKRTSDFYYGWFLSPLVFGDYPYIMKKNVGSRLPAFTQRESELIKGSFDFIGLVYYYTLYVKDNPSSLKTELRDFTADMSTRLIVDQTNTRPSGLLNLLDYLKNTYGNPPIYISENGKSTPYHGSLNGTPRVEYLQEHIGGMLDAIRNGSNMRGYFVWSFLDVYELLSGFDLSYGLYYVDREDNLTRYPKLSAHWYSNFLKGGNLSQLQVIKEIEERKSSSSQFHSLQ